ncbi:MAG: aminotransferase class I/II-fold pyridoxal phosphate-dependent enzyme [Pseudomonadota bacterium]
MESLDSMVGAEPMVAERLERLTDYPFARLRALLDGVQPPQGREPISMAVGEPQDPCPDFVANILAEHRADWNRYPPVGGTPAHNQACLGWLRRRFGAVADGLTPDQVLPLSGTREGMFLAAQALVPERKAGRQPVVCLPNPYYAGYEGSAVMSGAEPVYLDCRAETGFLPDLDALDPSLLARTALFFLCSPTNPQGVIVQRDYLVRLIGLARQHRFVLAVDECYVEIYGDRKPIGALEAAEGDLTGLLLFQSLSKRSNAAGLRAGFVVGDRALIEPQRRLRSYSAACMPLPVQAAAAALWDDDTHVAGVRDRYRQRFDAACAALAPHLSYQRAEAGFFLWLDVGDGVETAAALWREAGIRVLPGAFLSKAGPDGRSVGDRYVRIAVVHDPETIAEAMGRAAPILGQSREKAAADLSTTSNDEARRERAGGL